MDTYLVGGAVRDKLLGLKVTERDYVVVGATEDQMISRDFRPIGKDFPVFLHPQTKDEYALARTERKTGPGHKGFVCHASPDVTLEEDLARRDLTINAIAEDKGGNLVDPCGGVADLEARILRHASPAFVEDPLRILRVARLKARFHHLEFTVDPGTRALIREMVKDNLLSELPPERILGELDKALATPDPAEFFRFLMAVGAHDLLWPEIKKAAVDQLAANPPLPETDIQFASLLHAESGDTIAGLCARLHCSNQRTELALMVAEHLDTWRSVLSLDASDVMELLRRTDAMRKDRRFRQFNWTCDGIAQSPGGIASLWASLSEQAAAVTSADLMGRGLTGKALGLAIDEERERRIAALLKAQASK